MDHDHGPRCQCVQCNRELPIDMFAILKTHSVSAAYSLGAKGNYFVNERSFTCMECGTTTQEEWIKKWRQNS